LEDAQPLIAARYPDEPWRIGYTNSVRVGCLTELRRFPEAEHLEAAATAATLQKWPAGTVFGHAAVERSLRLYTRTGNQAKLAEYSAMLTRK
jgi:hypothetical protein